MSDAPKPTTASVNGWNAGYLEEQYTRWKLDPQSVPADMGRFFEGFDLAHASPRLGAGGAAQSNGAAQPAMAGDAKIVEDRAQAAVANLIESYRKVGHLCAEIDPFGRERPLPPSLDPSFHGLDDSNLETTFDAGSLSPDGSPIPLRTIIEILDQTYCRSIGVEFSHITDEDEHQWLAHRMESSRNATPYSRGERVHIMYQLHKAELFEKFCGKRYPGVKRFSLEGGESLIPMLDQMVEASGDEYGVTELVMGMSHRGRLNVLTNIVGKTYEQIFTEFEDAWLEDAALGGGDVKYHRGFSSNRVLRSGKHVWICMASNPSHLESACAVVLGRCRAKQRLAGDRARERHVPILMHGDAAFIGQGVVAETFNLSQLEGYTVGGCVHIVINNLIGFTTGQEDARSTRYCTDIAKMLEAPIFHVNGEDPEAVVHVAKLAIDYRMKFKKDVVIDMQCYRLHGHNETDEAAFTQPLLYAQIKRKPSVLKTYAERLLAEGVINEKDMDEIRRSLDEELDRAYEKIKDTPVDPTPDPGHRRWAGLTTSFDFDPVETGVDHDTLVEISDSLGRWPEGFTPHRKLIKTLQARSACIKDDQAFDWGTAEALAIGSLLVDGHLVRLTGQDSRRGTFSHRHAALRDMDTAEVYVPLNHIREMGELGDPENGPGTENEQGVTRQARLAVFDSPLSEFSCMGFEYGFSLASPDPLVLWEAQFGDFANGSQVIIDQYIASAEAKWQRWSSLTLLLPHGYEGQGPEHSSARLERFLQLCGDDNMQVTYPTTPAQYFHLLRRQVKRPFRKPLIVMTPKSLLRHPVATSRASQLESGSFQEILDDETITTKTAKRKVKRLILCCGKVYYDLVKRREEVGKQSEIAIVRIEQPYPFHADRFEEIISLYPDDVDFFWVQEEPKNMGAWKHMSILMQELWGWELPYVGRPASATPATGSPTKHAEQLEEFLSEAIGAAPAVAAEPQKAGAR